MTTSIGFTGDVMLGRRVDEVQHRRPINAVWGDLLDTLQSLDGLFINLECCLSTRGQPWQRTDRPFHFRADPDWAIPALEAAGVDCCALANNHILDFEEPALQGTLEHLDEAGIASAGAGQNRSTAVAPTLLSIDDLDVGFVSLTDNTPEYAASSDSPGTAHVDFDVDSEQTITAVQATLDQVRNQDPDILVASLHWGPNMVETPPDSFQTFAHRLIEEGADIIHGHSAHIFQGIEAYQGKPILYDTGDFVDDYAVDDELRNDRSFLFEAIATDTGTVTELRLHPTEIFDYAVHEADSRAASWSRDRMRSLSQPFGTEFERQDDALVLDLTPSASNHQPR